MRQKAKNVKAITLARQKVGRGRPPKHTQFSKGTSGNPTGRPKGSKNLGTLIMEAAQDQVAVRIDGKTRKISKLQATAMQLATKAAGGDPVSTGRFLDWVDEIEIARRSRQTDAVSDQCARYRCSKSGLRADNSMPSRERGRIRWRPHQQKYMPTFFATICVPSFTDRLLR